MVHCFLTGVQLTLESAFVLNRREARGLLAALNDRAATLCRLIEQFAPLDENVGGAVIGDSRRVAATRRKHRLVCKAVVDAMAPAFPEISLFLEWPQYQGQVRTNTLSSLQAHPQFGAAIRKLDGEALRAAGQVARAVLRDLDPKCELPKKTRLAISAVVCTHHCHREAAQVARMLSEAALGGGEPLATGLSTRELAAVRRLLERAKGTGRPEPVAKPELTHASPHHHPG